MKCPVDTQLGSGGTLRPNGTSARMEAPDQRTTSFLIYHSQLSERRSSHA